MHLILSLLILILFFLPAIKNNAVSSILDDGRGARCGTLEHRFASATTLMHSSSKAKIEEAPRRTYYVPRSLPRSLCECVCVCVCVSCAVLAVNALS